jgi:hypothetical protein
MGLLSIASYDICNDWRGSVRLENGVRVVENPEKPLYPPEVFKLQEEYTIKASGEGYLFVRPSQLLLDAFHNLYVRDNRESNIKVFDDHGRFLRIIGSKGVGPAELENPADMTITGNRLTVFSPQIARRTVFDLEGKYLDSGHYPMGLTAIRADSHGNVLCMNITRTEEMETRWCLQKYDANLKFIKEFASQAARPWQPWGGVQGPMFTVTRDDKIIYGFPDTYELKVFDNDGRLIGRIRKQHHAVRFPQEEIDFIRKKYHPSGSWDVFPKYHEPFYLIENDDDGRIIVMTIPSISHGVEHICDVFGPDGRFLATIKLKSNGDRLWANGRLYEIVEDEEGLPVVRVSKVIWNYRQGQMP